MSEELEFPYESPPSFDAALKDRLRDQANKGTYSMAELRRQFAYDRLLVRVFASRPNQWILKGGGGLLARIPDQARHSMDIDLFYDGELSEAVAEIQDLAADDTFGDFFTFDILTNGRQFTNAATGVNLDVVAFIGNKEFQRFNIDVVISSNMTKEPDIVTGLRPVSIPGLPSADYVVYSVVDHIADKHAAMIDTYGLEKRPSSRYRDLVDLVLLATNHSLEASELQAALFSEYVHRKLAKPTAVVAPDVSWETGYAREAAKVPQLVQQTLEAAMDVAANLLNPLLNDEDIKRWKPNEQIWTKK